MNEHEYYMKLCIEEAKKGLGFVAPNPMVGAILVKDGEILAKGYHKSYGQEHAEVNCLKQVDKQKAQGATLYVNLEPCCHWGNTPPCIDIILEYKISKIVVGVEDIDERVCGKSLKILSQNGIEIITGVLAKEAYDLNSMYFFYKKHQRPYIILKAAITLDAKIATVSKNSQWISSEESRVVVHKLRSQISAMVIGKNTFFEDRPRLTCRLPGFEQKPIHKLIFASKVYQEFFEHFKVSKGDVFVITPEIRENTQKFFNFCYKNKIQSLVVEGGQGVYSWFLQNDAVDRILLFINPSFMGQGIDIVKYEGITNVSQLKKYQIKNISQVGPDVFLDLTKGEEDCVLWLN